MTDQDYGCKLLVLLPESGQSLKQILPLLADVQEVKAILAESVKEWTREVLKEEWREGWKEGWRQSFLTSYTETLQQMRSILLHELTRRFGPLSDEARQCVEALGSIEEIMRLASRTGAATSLAALGLTDGQS